MFNNDQKSNWLFFAQGPLNILTMQNPRINFVDHAEMQNSEEVVGMTRAKGVTTDHQGT